MNGICTHTSQSYLVGNENESGILRGETIKLVLEFGKRLIHIGQFFAFGITEEDLADMEEVEIE